MKSHFTPPWWLLLRKSKRTASSGEDAEKLEPCALLAEHSATAVEGGSLGDLIPQKKDGCVLFQKQFKAGAQGPACLFILRAALLAIMCKQPGSHVQVNKLWHMLFLSLKENLDTHFNMDEPGGYYTKWNKLVTKYKHCVFTYIRYREWLGSWRQVEWWLLVAWEREVATGLTDGCELPHPGPLEEQTVLSTAKLYFQPLTEIADSVRLL